MSKRMLLLAIGVLGIAFLVREKRHVMDLHRQSVLPARTSTSDYRALNESRKLVADLKSAQMAYR